MLRASHLYRAAAVLLAVVPITRICAQNTDSLWTVWNDAQAADTARMDALGKLAWARMFSDADSALSLAMLLKETATAKQDRKYQALSLNHEGVAYTVLGNYYAAHVSYQQMLELNESRGDKKGIGGAHINLGVIYQEQGDNLRALHHYAKSVEVFEALGDKRSLATVYNNIGGIYNEQGDTAQAFNYMRKSMDIHKSSDNQRAYSSALGNMGLVYMEQGLMDKALALFNESLALKKGLGDKAGMAKSLHDLGELYRRHGPLDSAYACLKRSMSLREELGDEQGLAATYTSMGFYDIDKHYMAEAIGWCMKGYTLARDLGLRSHERNACECLYKANKALGDNDAFFYHERWAALGDSLRSAEVAEQLKGMEFKRLVLADSLTKVAAELKARLQKEQRTSDVRKKMLWGGGLVVPVIAVAVAMRRRRARKAQA